MKSQNPHAALYWAIPLVAACVYLGGYGVVRWQEALKRHMIGNAEGQYYWIAGWQSRVGKRSPWLEESVVPSLELIYRPLCKAEGKMWMWLLSEEVELLEISLPPR